MKVLEARSDSFNRGASELQCPRNRLSSSRVNEEPPLGIPRTWKREWASVMWTNLGLAIVTALGWVLIGIDRFLLVQVPIMLISGALGVRCARLHLWDEDEGRLVGFRHLRALRAGA